MFVRFKTRKLKFWGDKTLEVILVSNQRSGGRVQQKCLKYLGSIRFRRLELDNRKAGFWRKVRESLVALGLDHEIQREIKGKISKLVPIPKEMDNLGKGEIPPTGLREKMQLLSQRRRK